MNRASLWLLAMIGVFLVSGIVGAIGFSRYLFWPLHQTIAAIDRFRVDQPLWPIAIERSDELGLLVRAVNRSLRELKTSHDEFAHWQRQLCEAARLASVGLISAGLAHEINNPLAEIRNCAARIAAAPDRVDQSADYAAMIIESTDHISAVMRNLLDYSRARPTTRGDHRVFDLVERSVRLLDIRL